MLILTRRTGETIFAGHDIKITVLGVSGNQARIGIDAPKDMEVHREEIYHKIHGPKAANAVNPCDENKKEEFYNDLCENSYNK